MTRKPLASALLFGATLMLIACSTPAGSASPAATTAASSAPSAAASPAAESPAAASPAAASPVAEGKKLLGMVSITVNDSSNARFIKGATAAAQAAGWEVSVIDAHGNADEANAAIQNLIQRKATAIIDLVFPVTSLGAGLAAAQTANVPVGTWGGGLGNGVVATNGSGGPQAEEIVKQMVADLGGKGQILALTYHTGQVCRDREQVLDDYLKAYPDIKVTKNEVKIPGYLQDGAQYTAAWLAGKPAGSGPLAIWGCWDDPALGGISSLKQQGRTDVKVYGQNGNADAINAVKDGTMTATSYAQVEEEGKVMFQTLLDAMQAGASWQPKAVEVPVIVVNNQNVEQFIKDHPEAIQAPK